MIEICFEDVEIPGLDPEFFALWLNKVCKSHDKQLGDVTLVFCSDDYLLEMNKEHLDHDYYTDIITFDNSDSNRVEGDVFISIDRVTENAKEFQVPVHNEFARVAIHGLLHLLGYNDKTDKQIRIMREKENAYLSLLE